MNLRDSKATVIRVYLYDRVAEYKRAGFFEPLEFIMTFKKINKSGQSVLEYIVLTTAVAAVVLFSTTRPHFENVQYACNLGLEQVVQEIIK